MANVDAQDTKIEFKREKYPKDHILPNFKFSYVDLFVLGYLVGAEKYGKNFVPPYGEEFISEGRESLSFIGTDGERYGIRPNKYKDDYEVYATRWRGWAGRIEHDTTDGDPLVPAFKWIFSKINQEKQE